MCARSSNEFLIPLWLQRGPEVKKIDTEHQKYIERTFEHILFYTHRQKKSNQLNLNHISHNKPLELLFIGLPLSINPCKIPIHSNTWTCKLLATFELSAVKSWTIPTNNVCLSKPLNFIFLSHKPHKILLQSLLHHD